MSLPTFLTEPNPEIYNSNNYVVVDYETGNNDKGNPRLRDNKLLYAGWCVGKDHSSYKGRGVVRGSTADEFSQQALIRDIEEADFVIAQNSKFEIQWSKRLGIPLESVLWFCTILASYTIDGNKRRPRDLNSLCKRYNIPTKSDLVSLLIKGGVHTEEIPIQWLGSYCKQDVRITEELFLAQREELNKKGLLPVQYTKNLFTPVLADIELNGMFLDGDRVRELHTERTIELAEVQNELSETYGEINFNSPLQVANLVYGSLGFTEPKDRSGKAIRNKPSKAYPKGQPKTDAETLRGLRATTERQKRFVSLYGSQSKLSKQVSTYLNKFLDAVENNRGHLYGKFNQAVTQTHRLSSSGPNFQNFDRTLKPLFTTRNRDWLLGERDEAQLEFRVAAFLGRDEQAVRDIQDGFDVHTFTARIIYDGDITKDVRTAAKAHTFKPLFGGVSGTTRERAYYQAFREKYSSITETQDGWVDKAISDGTYLNSTGLMFHHNVKVTQSGYVEGNTNVRNYPIQYLATGEIVPIGCIYMWHEMKARQMQSIMVNTVHDSVITEEHPDESEELTTLAEKAFGEDVIQYLNKVYGIDFDVPLELDTETYTHWSSN